MISYEILVLRIQSLLIFVEAIIRKQRAIPVHQFYFSNQQI